MTLKAEEISFSYQKDKISVLKDVSVEFGNRAVTAVTGANGCGKTTLCKILVGILKPSQGRVSLNGVGLEGLSLAQIGVKIGFVMQNPEQQLFCKTVREELEYGLRNLKLDQVEIEKRCEYFLDYFDITGYENRFPFQLSRGEKQRVILAAVLAMQPEYLILDEPTASLDRNRQHKLGEYLLKVREELNCGIILISHDQGFVRTYSDRVLTMRQGGELNVSAGDL